MPNPAVRFICFLILTCLAFNVVAVSSDDKSNREALELIGEVKNLTGDILGNISTAAGELLAFVDQRLAIIYPVIQKFKSLITSDPFNVIQTWVGHDICSYRGFYCDNPPDNRSAIAVASIDFNGFQLSAPSIEGFLDQLPDLALFHANSNNFGGTVPSKIANLEYLYELDISNNRFSGQFPTAFLSMSGLTFLDLRYNLFSGSVPPQIFNQNLEVLFINNNDFTSNLPESFGETQLLYLTLANNKFNGPIPRSIIEAASTLTEVLFLNNQLSGCLPHEIGFLKEVKVFDVGENRFTGPLPLSLICLEKAEQLNFAGNLFFGAVPETVCRLENLVNLSLSDNYFTHIGPFCRELMEKGVIDLRNNCIPFLPNQRSSKECLRFFAKPSFCPRMLFHSYFPCRFSSSESDFDSLMPMVAPSP